MQHVAWIAHTNRNVHTAQRGVSFPTYLLYRPHHVQKGYSALVSLSEQGCYGSN